MVQSEDGPLFLPDGIDTGDQRIREESVDVDSNVSFECPMFERCQASDVTPASCPTSNASNVIENCCVLEGAEHHLCRAIAEHAYLSPAVFTFSTCFFREICRPPSSPSLVPPSDASKASSSSSLNVPDSLSVGNGRLMASMFQRRILAS